MRKSFLGDRDAFFDQRTDFFGFLQRRNDATAESGRVDLRLTVRLEHAFVKTWVSLSQEKTASQVSHQRFSMTGSTTEMSATSFMSHDFTSITSNGCR